MLRRFSRLLLFPTLLVACGGGPDGEPTPLVDGQHAPLVLTEQVLLDKPPAYSGNRFLAGWWPGSRSHDPSQVNVGDRVVLEAVFLDERERRLSTRMEIRRGEPGATFGVRVAGVELPPQALVRDAEIPLPSGLALGRLPIELDLRGAQIEVQAAGFGHAWPPGEVELDAAVISQGGVSVVDFPRRLTGPATLVGRFEPPPSPEPDQRFALLVETDGGVSDTAFEWRPGSWRDRLGARRLRLPLPGGFVRIRLLAQGLGPAGRWLDMGIVGGDDDDTAITLRRIEGRAGDAWAAASERYQLIRAPALGLPADADRSRDAEYLYDLHQDPERTRNLAGARSVEVDWLRARLESWIAAGAGP